MILDLSFIDPEPADPFDFRLRSAGYPDFPECQHDDFDVLSLARGHQEVTMPVHMSPLSTRPCQCGSGLDAWAEYDARGVFIGYTCHLCNTERLAHFRPEVLTDPNYDCDEPVDPDD